MEEEVKKGRRSIVDASSKERAFSLRSMGYTYSEIVKEFNGFGVTDNWCKKNLAKIQPVRADEFKCIEELKALALRPKGVTTAEAYKVIRTIYNIWGDAKEDGDRLYSLYRKLKAKVERCDENVLFRPSSINPYRALDSKQWLLDASNELHETVNQLCDSYYQHLYEGHEDEWCGVAVRDELLSLSFPSLGLKGGTTVRSSYLDRTCAELGVRLGLYI